MSKRVLQNRLLRGLVRPKPKPIVYRVPRYNEAEKRFHGWVDSKGSRGRTIEIYVYAERSGVSARRLFALTKGAPFRLDFGRGRDGKQLTFLRTDGPQGLERWAKHLDVAS